MSRILKDWITSYLAFVENTEPCDLYKEWTAISVIAAALQRKCYLPWGHLTFYPNMYIILIGPPGSRKNTAMDTGHDLLRDANIKLAADATTRAGLVEELDGAQHADLVDGKGLKIHASLTVFSEELSVFFGYDERQMVADLRDWYDCKPVWINKTKGSGVSSISGVWLNLIGGITPDLLQGMPPDIIGGGLARRIIFVSAPGKGKSCPAPFLTVEDHKLREDLLHDLKEVTLMSGDFKWTDEFLDVYITWYCEQDERPPITSDPRFAGYLSCRPMHLMKLCMALGASEGEDMVVTKGIFDRALSTLERAEVPMFDTFTGLGRSELSEVTASVMKTVAAAQKITATELLNMYYHDADLPILERIIETMVAMKFCKRVIDDKGAVSLEYIRRTENDQHDDQGEIASPE